MSELADRILDLLTRRAGRPHTVEDVAKALYGLKGYRAAMPKVRLELNRLAIRRRVQSGSAPKETATRIYLIGKPDA